MPITLNGDTGITTPSYGGVDVAEYLVPVTAFKNRIINGSMMIDQRNAGASVNLTDGVYNLDRYQGSVSQASKVTVQRSTTAPAGFINSQLLTVSSVMTIGAGDYCGNAQAIEGLNCSDLGFGTANAQSVTVSFWARSSITGTYSIALHNSAADRSCAKAYTILSANTWEYKTVTFTGDTSGTWLTINGIGIKVYFALAMGTTYGGATDGTWNAGLKLAVTGQTQWATNSGATFYITGVQLEKGSTATSFDYRPYTTELVLCQRYYQTYQKPEGRGVMNGVANLGRVGLPLQVQMRAAPTMNISGTIDWFDGGNVGTVTALNATYTTINSIEFDAIAATGTTVVGRPSVLYNGSNTGSLTASAEL